MILASDFSGIGLAFIQALLIWLGLSFAIGAATALVVRLSTRFKRTWLLIPTFSVLWFVVFGGGWYLYWQWKQSPRSEEQAFAQAVIQLGGYVVVNGDRQVVQVYLGQTGLTDADLERLVRLAGPGLLARVTELQLMRTGITDAGLPHVAQFGGLYTLGLRETAVTDAGLKHLAGLKKLGVLYLSKTKVTMAGLEHLKRSKSLRTLDLRDTDISDDDRVRLLIENRDLQEVDQIYGFHGFQTDLNLSGRQITDDVLKDLAGWDGLDTLRLCDTQITDDGLAYLKGLPLTALLLDGTEVTDAGLEHLTGCPTLHWVHLHRTRVTDDGVAEFQKALPRCGIER